MIHNVEPQLSQWDVGRSVSVSDTNATHIHFANPGDSKAVIIEIENGSAKIPAYLLQTGKTVIAYSVLDGVTLESKSFPVRKRERPENYVYEDDQRNYIYELITSAEEATAEAKKVASELEEAKKNGDFTGPQGAQGPQGVPGVNAEGSILYIEQNLLNEQKTQARKNIGAASSDSADIINEATGNPLILKDSSNRELQGLKLYGKNLIDYRKAYARNSAQTVTVDESIEGLYWTGTYYFVIPVYVPAGTTIKFSCEMESVDTGYDSYCDRVDLVYADGTTQYVNVIANETITLTKDLQSVRPHKSNTDDNNQVKVWNIQLEIGTVVTEYEPYLGGRNVTVKVMGKNLIDYRKAVARRDVEIVTIDESINGLYWTGTYYFHIPVSIPAGTTVCFSCKSESTDPTVNNCMHSLNINYADGTSGYQVLNAPFTVEKDVVQISPRREKSDINNTIKVWDLQLEIGNTATDYEPYKEQNLVVSVPNGIGTDGFVCEDCAELHTYKPNTTIINDVGAIMEVEYVADTKTYINNKFTELQNAILSSGANV